MGGGASVNTDPGVGGAGPTGNGGTDQGAVGAGATLQATDPGTSSGTGTGTAPPAGNNADQGGAAGAYASLLTPELDILGCAHFV